jgi:FKBP-type peptidyl-prolyl cis-trans isomerase FklB
MKDRMLKRLKAVFYILLPLIGGGWAGVSCSEDDATVDEFENWQVRNDIFFASLEDSLANGQGTWKKYKVFSKDPAEGTGAQTDYIYVKVIPTGYETTDTVSPLFNDSVRVSYQGRLIPSDETKNPGGKIFDGTVYGKYDVRTNATVCFKVSGMLKGFTTALLHMHRGDTWRVYIPYDLGYGSACQTSIPAYSTLIFDMTLYDIAEEGKAFEKF